MHLAHTESEMWALMFLCNSLWNLNWVTCLAQAKTKKKNTKQENAKLFLHAVHIVTMNHDLCLRLVKGTHISTRPKPMVFLVFQPEACDR